MIATLVEDMKPVVAVKDDFGSRDKSKVIVFFWSFCIIKFLIRGKNQWFDLSMDFHEFQIFGRDQDGRFQAFGHVELRVSISR